MKYYFINNSLNNKIVGTYPQVINAIHHCDVWNEPKFIDRIDFVKIDIDPIVSNAILEKKAKLTDLISAGNIGFSLKLLISTKFKDIIEKYSKNQCQFFNSSVIFKNEKIDDYWLLHPFNFGIEFIDFSNCKIVIRVKKKEGGTEPKVIQVNSYKEFLKIFEYHKEKMEITTITNVHLKDEINKDFFILKYGEGGVKYIVSEVLKKEIEDAGCTGIEFQPVELSYQEWTAPGGEREKF